MIDYKTAKRRQQACITSLLMLFMFGWGAVSSHTDSILKSPKLGFLILGTLFGLPTLLFIILTIFYSIKVKQLEYDDFDDDIETLPNDTPENNNDNN